MLVLGYRTLIYRSFVSWCPINLHVLLDAVVRLSNPNNT